MLFLDRSRRIYGTHWVAIGFPWDSKRKVFSYNERRMDRAMGPFSPLWQFLKSIICMLAIRQIVRLPSPPPITRLLSISYGRLLISHNSILPEGDFSARLFLSVFLLADSKPN